MKFSCRASVTDLEGASNQVSSTIVVDNRVPIVTMLALSNNTPEADDEVVCSANSFDEDGETPILSYSWEIDGSSAGSTNTIILDPIMVAGGSELTCVVTAEDSYGGVGIETLSTSIINTDPTVFDISITPNTGIYTGTEVSCLASGDDLNDGPLTPDYDWSVSGNVIGTGSTYIVDAVDTDVGDNIVCTASVMDNDGATASVTSSIIVENTAPTITNIQISSSSNFFL